MAPKMALAATTDVSRVEAPITWKAYAMCAFAAFGGMLFGYDSGYISGILATKYVIALYTGNTADGAALPAWMQTLIVSILSAGTFFGAVAAGDFADWLGRRTTVILGCAVYAIGVIIQTAQSSWQGLVVGRAIAGIGAGLESATVILYMSEISPKGIRGAVVSCYQFFITIGIFLGAIVNYCTEDRTDSGSYRIPVAVQFVWAIILSVGLACLPETPRFFVRKGNVAKAAGVLGRLRSQPPESEYVQAELAEIVANHEYEMSLLPPGGYFASWAACFTGSLWRAESNLRRTILGTSLQMMQQWTGVNFIFYFGTVFFSSLKTIDNPFVISVITNAVNVASTPISFWAIERFGRRPLLITGAIGMFVCQMIVAIIGDAKHIPSGANDKPATSAIVAFICIYIAFFASTWGPGAWVVIGEIFPLPIRARGVALSTASNWLWNCVIAVITPYLVGADKANLSTNVFWLWGSLCGTCIIYAYFLIPETKGLSLEQVDRMLESTNARNSSKWKPTSTFAADLGVDDKGMLKADVIEDVEAKGAHV